MAELQQRIERGSSVNAGSYVNEGFFGLGEDDDFSQTMQDQYLSLAVKDL